MKLIESKIREFEKYLFQNNPILYSSLLPGIEKDYFLTSQMQDLISGLFIPIDIQLFYGWRSGTKINNNWMYEDLNQHRKNSLEIEPLRLFLDVRESMNIKFDRQIRIAYEKEEFISPQDDILFVPLLVDAQYFAADSSEEDCADGFSCVCFPICSRPLLSAPLIYTSENTINESEFIFDNVLGMLNYWCASYAENLIETISDEISMYDLPTLRRRGEARDVIKRITNPFSNSRSVYEWWQQGL